MTTAARHARRARHPGLIALAVMAGLAAVAVITAGTMLAARPAAVRHAGGRGSACTPGGSSPRTRPAPRGLRDRTARAVPLVDRPRASRHPGRAV